MKRDGLEGAFLRIRKSFFSRWRHGDEWSVTSKHDDPFEAESEGLCITEKKRIYINPQVVRTGGDNLRVILIHEICHALTGTIRHGVLFQRRMRKALRDVELNQDGDLATDLRAEVALYENDDILTHDVAYQLLNELASEGADYSGAVDAICRRYDMKKGDFHRVFKKAQQVFSDATKLWSGFRPLV